MNPAETLRISIFLRGASAAAHGVFFLESPERREV